MSRRIPRAVFLDLDDTILDDTSAVDLCWDLACDACAPGDERDRLIAQIKSVRDWYWSDADRHRVGRLDMDVARRHIVRSALEQLGRDDDGLAVEIADRYSSLRDVRVAVLPGALETLEWFRAQGCRLALLTNGAGPAQRRKIDRFGLEPFFDAVLIEGELGFGKPDARVFEEALSACDVLEHQAWMVGDSLHSDIVPAVRLGIHTVWVDVRGGGLPATAPCVPSRTVSAIADLRAAV